MDGWLQCSSCLLGSFLLTSLSCGIISIALGSTLQIQLYTKFLEGASVNQTTILFIVAGCLSVLICLTVLMRVGCRGCLTNMCYTKGHRCLVLAFFLLFGGIALCQLVGGVIVYAAGDIGQILNKNMEASLLSYDPSSKSDSHAWDRLQHTEHCCGLHSYTDWYDNRFYSYGKVPDSCCVTKHSDCGQFINPSKLPSIYTIGCLEKIGENSEYLTGLIATSGLVLGLVQLCCLFTALTLITPIRHCFLRSEYQEIIAEDVAIAT